MEDQSKPTLWLDDARMSGGAAEATPDGRRVMPLVAAALLLAGSVAGGIVVLGGVDWRARLGFPPRAAPVAVARVEPVSNDTPADIPAPQAMDLPVAEALPPPLARRAAARAQEREQAAIDAMPSPAAGASAEAVASPQLSNRVRDRLRHVRQSAQREDRAERERERRAIEAAADASRAAQIAPAGSSGQIVQLASFSGVAEAQMYWRTVAARWPYLTTKPRILSPEWVPAGDGYKLNYRLQLGTASQAQSLVICQRLTKARQPCVVVY